MAGRLYPDDPGALTTLVQELFDAAPAAPAPASDPPVLGAVVPHAGLRYSGVCAARVLARLGAPEVAIVLAPNHTGRGDPAGRASVFASGAFAIPTGHVSVDAALADALLAATTELVVDRSAHVDEHAIEVELPLMQARWPGASIVPIVISSVQVARCLSLGASMASVLHAWPARVLLLASSDLTHHEEAASAARKDRCALERIQLLDARGLLEVCARESMTMCGRGPVAVMLEACRRLGAVGAEVVDYRHSGWVNGDTRNVVSYAGVVVR